MDFPRPLRIAHLSFSTLPRNVGGLEVVVDSLIRNQIKIGCDAKIVTRWKQSAAIRNAKFPYQALPLLPNRPLGGKGSGAIGPRWPVALAIAFYQWRYRFDVWHLHTLYPTGWMAQPTLLQMGVPVVITPHGVDVNTHSEAGFGLRLNRKHNARIEQTVLNASKLTALTPSVKAELLALGADPRRITQVPNGVWYRYFSTRTVDRDAYRKAHGIPKGKPVILSVGRNIPSKGFDQIPLALARLHALGIPATWLVVGQDTGALNAAARAVGVGDHLLTFPPVPVSPGAERFPSDALIDIYKSADVFAFPSLSEGFGLVVLEAMAAGLPVVVANSPGLRDLVVDEVDGLLTPPSDAQMLGDTIARILQDFDLREKLIECGLRKAKAHDWAAIATEYMDIYASVTTKEPTRRFSSLDAPGKQRSKETPYYGCRRQRGAEK